MIRLVAPLRLLLAIGLLSGMALGQETKEAPKARAKSRPSRPVHGDSGREYMGREIADVMSYLGADWLIRPEREDEERPEAMLDALKLKPGDTVADIGAGVGYTSLRIARRVAPDGTVYATDIQPQMIDMLKANVKQAGAKNVKPTLCTAADTKLPDGRIDLAIMVDVYHECPDPAVTLKGIRKALRPGGRLVLVEFRGEDPEVPIKPEHKMTVVQVRKEVEPQGFAFKELHDFLPWQHIIVFEKPEDPKPPAEKKP